MKTIKDFDRNQWNELDFDDKLDVAINTMFVHNKINIEEKVRVGEFDHEVTIELSCVEDDDKKALTEGWICIEDKPRVTINLWRGNGQPYFTDADSIMYELFNYLKEMEE